MTDQLESNGFSLKDLQKDLKTSSKPLVSKGRGDFQDNYPPGSKTLTWEEKFMSFRMIPGNCPRLHMPRPGCWVVDDDLWILKSKNIKEKRGGEGTTPELAVESHFKNHTQLQEGEIVEYDDQKVVWDGEQWMICS
jgi:hypothetical protein